MREHPRRRQKTAPVPSRVAIVVGSLNLDIDRLDRALLLLRQIPPAGWFREPAESLEDFFVDQDAEAVA